MTEQSRIDKGLYWDRAWSLVSGCTPVSEGCRHCWSAREAHVRGKQSNRAMQVRYGGLTDEAGQWTGEVRLMHGDLEKPLRVQKPTTWSVWNDLFHEDVPDYFIYRALAVMNRRPQHMFLALTKRAERMAYFFETFRMDRFYEAVEWVPGGDEAFNYDWPMPNFGLGVTAENQQMADKRIGFLAQALPMAGFTFISFEPLLGLIQLWRGLERPQGDYQMLIDVCDWIICGGESGPGARPMHPDWARSLRDRATAAGVPFFMKQWGAWLPISDQAAMGLDWGLDDRIKWMSLDGKVSSGPYAGWHAVHRVGKKRAGRLLDGQEWNEMPSTEALDTHE